MDDAVASEKMLENAERDEGYSDDERHEGRF
jgi:hypothetical protein